jgi:hypothetical protein
VPAREKTTILAISSKFFIHTCTVERIDFLLVIRRKSQKFFKKNLVRASKTQDFETVFKSRKIAKNLLKKCYQPRCEENFAV